MLPWLLGFTVVLASSPSLAEVSEQTTTLVAEVPDHTTTLARLYGERGGVIWTQSAGLSPVGEVAVRWLRDAPHHGLPSLESTLAEFDAFLAVLVPHAGPASSDPTLHVTPADVARVLSAPQPSPDASSPGDQRARLEAGIAVALADLVARLTHRPRTEPILKDEKRRYAPPDILWAVPPAHLDAATLQAMLAAAATSPDVLETWLQARLPKVRQYNALLTAARHYGALCEEGGWEPIPVTRYRRGLRWKDEEAIRTLQARLKIEGFYKTEPNGLYDEAMKESVRSYQASRQLRANGRYDRKTSESLNIPCAERLTTLHLNLRRWRHTARTAESAFVEVNLAGQEVRYVVGGEERMRKRTVVGSGKWYWSRREKRRIYPKKSPLLTDLIEKIVVNPSWTIPSSIVKQEILPRVEKDPTYLERKGYIVKQSKRGKDVYVQPPGPRNTLGEVKLLFPNAEAIYLHDTNNRYLFRTARRDMSHGCIRVEHALDFATAIMAEEHERLEKYFHPRSLHRLSRRKRTVVFKLDQPVPVFLEYYTASVDPEGIVRFHPDVYEYDLAVALGNPVPRRLPKALRR